MSCSLDCCVVAYDFRVRCVSRAPNGVTGFVSAFQSSTFVGNPHQQMAEGGEEDGAQVVSRCQSSPATVSCEALVEQSRTGFTRSRPGHDRRPSPCWEVGSRHCCSRRARSCSSGIDGGVGPESGTATTVRAVRCKVGRVAGVRSGLASRTRRSQRRIVSRRSAGGEPPLENDDNDELATPSPELMVTDLPQCQSTLAQVSAPRNPSEVIESANNGADSTVRTVTSRMEH